MELRHEFTNKDVLKKEEDGMTYAFLCLTDDEHEKLKKMIADSIPKGDDEL